MWTRPWLQSSSLVLHVRFPKLQLKSRLLPQIFHFEATMNLLHGVFFWEGGGVLLTHCTVSLPLPSSRSAVLHSQGSAISGSLFGHAHSFILAPWWHFQPGGDRISRDGGWIQLLFQGQKRLPFGFNRLSHTPLSLSCTLPGHGAKFWPYKGWKLHNRIARCPFLSFFFFFFFLCVCKSYIPALPKYLSSPTKTKLAPDPWNAGVGLKYEGV